MAIASREDKQQVIEALKNANGKYSKPFEKGKMARTSIMGGNWEEYAQIVMSMVTADTLLDVDAQLERLNQNIEALVIALGSQPPPAVEGPTPSPAQASTPSPSPSAAQGSAWLADPTHRHELRYLDSGVWTEHVSDGGVQGIDPPGPTYKGRTRD